MHLALDVREACRPTRTGKGQWTYGFVTELLERDVAITFFTDRSLPDAWQRRVDALQTARRRVVSFPRKGMVWHWMVARYARTDGDINIYVSPTSTIVPSLLGSRVPCIPVVHDLIAFRHEPHDLKAMAVERLTLGKIVRSAAHICTVSQSTKADLLARYPRLCPTHVTSIGAGPVFAGTSEHSPDGRTILCIGTLCPRKNQKRLIEAYAQLPPPLREQYRLVLVGGRGWKDLDIVAAARSTEGVEWREYLPDDECRKLLLHATVLVFPSLYEGFGLPVLDALAGGVPVLTSDRGSLREVAGDAAVIIDPDDTGSIATGLQQLLENTALRAQLSERGREQAARFTWLKTVDLLLEIVRQVKI